MPVPTHRPDCHTEKYFKTKCQFCGKQIFFWSCTCGSRLFFETRDPDWIKHDCRNTSQTVANKSSVQQQINLKPTDISNPLIECPFCGERMRGKDLARHARLSHVKTDLMTDEEPEYMRRLRFHAEGADKSYYLDENGFFIGEVPKNKKRGSKR